MSDAHAVYPFWITHCLSPLSRTGYPGERKMNS